MASSQRRRARSGGSGRARIDSLLKEPATREAGLEQLGQSSVRTAASMAARHLQDRDAFVRNAALECLRERGSIRYADRVARLLSDDDEIVRITAMECLVSWGARSQWTLLRRRLRDPAPLVRAHAGWALGKLRARGALGALRARLRRERSGIARAGILEALGVLTGDDSFTDKLIALLRHRDYHVRRFVANSLVGVAPRNSTKRIAIALREAVGREQWRGVREAIEEKLRLLTST